MLLLPLFVDPGRTAVAGVVEIVQASTTMPFTNMVEVLSDAFKVGLPPRVSPSLRDQTPPARPARLPYTGILSRKRYQIQELTSGSGTAS